jgi:hypothetical protein
LAGLKQIPDQVAMGVVGLQEVEEVGKRVRDGRIALRARRAQCLGSIRLPATPTTLFLYIF